MARTRAGILALVALAACGRFRFDPVDGLDDTDGGSGSGVGDGGTTDADGLSADTYNIAFVTSESRRIAEIGGVAGADTLCNQLALDAGLPGTYVAWLSDGTTNAPARLAGARGWIRPDGKPLVDTVADLVAGHLLYPIVLNESSVAYTAQSGVTTGTLGDGTLGTDCDNWGSISSGSTATSGIASTTFTTWTENLNLPSACDQPQPFYCFGTDHDVALQYAPATGRRAFVSSEAWMPAGGTDGADAACQTAADTASLGGSWRALLATTTAPAADRFNKDASTWVRLDGIALGPTASEVLSGGILDAPLNLTETMQYRGSNPANTGATSVTALGASNSTCLDWMSSSASDTQRVGLLNSVTLYFSTPIFQTCSSGAQLYCLER